MRRYINDQARTRVCACGHNKTTHYASVATPQAPCRACECLAYEVEPICQSCNHGRSQHRQGGRCHNGCGCAWVAA